MRRTNGKWRHTSSKSATEQLFDLAAAAQNLLVKLLPRGVDAALDQIRQVQSSLRELPDELDYLRSEPRLVIHATLLVAEHALATYIEKQKIENCRQVSGIE
jgi:hypothetical protein